MNFTPEEKKNLSPEEKKELEKSEQELQELARLEKQFEENQKKFVNIKIQVDTLRKKRKERQKENGSSGNTGMQIMGQDPKMWIQILIGIVAVSFALNFFSGGTESTQIPISEFQRELYEEIFSTVKISGDTATGEKKSGEIVTTIIGQRDSFNQLGFFDVDKIGDTQISITSNASSQIWKDILMSFLPLILLLGLMVYSMKGLKGGMGGFPFGGKQKGTEPIKPDTRFADVAGNDEPKFELKEIVDFLKSPEKFTKMGAKIPKGVLMSGPPGTGKTLLARAVAGEAHVPFFSISGSEFVEMFVGVGASRVRTLFENARAQAPAIIFIDEIDAIGGKRSNSSRGGGNSEQEQTLNQILTEMDGFVNETGVIVMAATNREDMLDNALLRPGRFDRRITVMNPTIKDREAILAVHAKGKPFEEGINLYDIASRTAGFSGADLANLLNEAAINASRSVPERQKITALDVDIAMDRITMGTEKKSLVMSDIEKKMTAYHEVGHALAAHLLPTTDPVHKITIVPRGQTLGATHIAPDTESYHTTKNQYFEQMCVLLGGLTAEKIIFKDTTSGVSNDLERASRIANAMVMKFGMSDEIGPIVYSAPGEQSISKPHSEAFAQKIDTEVQTLLKNAYAKTTQLFNDNIDLLNTISLVLLEKETLDRTEFEAFFGGKRKEVVKLQEQK